MQEFVLMSDQFQLILIAKDFVPSVRPLERIANVARVALCLRTILGWFVHETGLRDAKPFRHAMPSNATEQGNLVRERKLLAEMVVTQRSPKNEAARKREQVKFAQEIRFPHRSRQSAKGPERQEILD